VEKFPSNTQNIKITRKKILKIDTNSKNKKEIKNYKVQAKKWVIKFDLILL